MRGGHGDNRLRVVSVGFVFFGALGGLAAWLLLHGREGWSNGEVLQATGLVAGICGGIATSLQAMLGQRRAERDEATQPRGPTTLNREQREAWREVLRDAVLDRRVGGEGSQLDQMIRKGSAIDLGARAVEARKGDRARPRLLIAGQTVPWSSIADAWDRTSGRLVVLGDPGYGKTVAALTLLKHINTRSGPGDAVAELFPLVEWYRWIGTHPHGRLRDWLADELALTYTELSAATARALIDADLVLPLLDGLDEVPAAERGRCKDTIDAYAERTSPFRPFVVTCRVREYAELAPDWVAADRVITLVGLERDQIVDEIRTRTSADSGWGTVCDRLVAGDQGLTELFRSPLRLAVALQVYNTRDPTELIGHDPATSREHLWELLLARDGPTFRGCDTRQIREWLAFLAAGMKRQSRQRFWLHELPLFVPDGRSWIRRFRWRLGPVVGLAVCAMIAAAFFPVYAFLASGIDVRFVGPISICGGIVAMAVVTLGATEQPSVRMAVPWRTRIRSVVVAKRPATIGLFAGGLVGAVVWLFTAVWDPRSLPLLVVAGCLIGVAATLSFAAVSAGKVMVLADPPRRLAGTGPSGILRASRTHGLVTGAIAAILCGAAAALILAVTYFTAVGRPVYWPMPLAFGLSTCFASFAVVSIRGGLGAWLYFHWLRRRLARMGLLPEQLREFLDWCSMPERGWLRASDAYEFRHRELLDHLAPSAPVPEEPRRREQVPNPRSGSAADDVARPDLHV